MVYAWGVLYHTGAMREALTNAATLVRRGGTLAFALYRKTPLCRAWAWEKRWYSHASPAGQRQARNFCLALIRLYYLLRGPRLCRL